MLFLFYFIQNTNDVCKRTSKWFEIDFCWWISKNLIYSFVSKKTNLGLKGETRKGEKIYLLEIVWIAATGGFVPDPNLAKKIDTDQTVMKPRIWIRPKKIPP